MTVTSRRAFSAMLVVLIFAAATPFVSSADTIADLQQQIKALLAQLEALKATTQSAAAPSASCVTLAYSIGPDDDDAGTGGDVSRLQQFLKDQRVYSGPISGYVGPLTLKAIQQWQSSHGIVSAGDPDSTGYGYVGPKTRERMKCGATSSTQSLSTNVVMPPTPTIPNTLQVPAAVPRAAYPASVAGSDWPPAWLSGSGISNLNSWNSMTLPGCNARSFGTHPALGNIVIGRRINSNVGDLGCEGKNGWSLQYYTVNWSTNAFSPGRFLLDTRSGPVRLGDGHMVRAAYDASVMLYNNTLWVAFECDLPESEAQTASTCIGPLSADMTLDLAHTVAVVYGSASNGYIYSASVPKLLVFRGDPYLYWTVVKMNDNSAHEWQQLTTRGARLELAQGSLRVQGSSGSPVAAYNDPRGVPSVEVWGLEVDARSNTVADLFQVVSDGSYIYFTGARGGTGCTTPAGTSPGCYRLSIGRTTTPLGERAFNTGLISDNFLPGAAHEYSYFVRRPSDGSTVLLVGSLAREPRYTAWRDVIVPTMSAPSRYTLSLALRSSADLAAPSNPQMSCTPDASSGTLSWAASPGASTYRLFLPSSVTQCPWFWTRDESTRSCTNIVSATSIMLSMPASITYDIDVYAVGADGSVSSNALRVPRATINACQTSGTPATPKETFVRGLYSCIFNREADTGGLAGWVRTSGTFFTFFNGFFASTEYTNQGDDNGAYVSRLYQCVLSRTADSAGRASNSAQLNSGALTRTDMLHAFVESGEFQQGRGRDLQSTTGIALDAQCVAPAPQTQTLSCPTGHTGAITQTRSARCAAGASAPTWSEWTTTANTCVSAKETFVRELYQCVFNREADSGGVATWVATSGNFFTFYNGFFASQEYTNQGDSNTAYVSRLYRCVLGREADAGGLSHNVGLLDAGSLTRTDMLHLFVEGAEFRQGRGAQLQQTTGITLALAAPQTSNLANALSALQSALEALQRMFR